MTLWYFYILTSWHIDLSWTHLHFYILLCWYLDILTSWHFDILTFWHLTIWTSWYLNLLTCWHLDICTSRHSYNLTSFLLSRLDTASFAALALPAGLWESRAGHLELAPYNTQLIFYRKIKPLLFLKQSKRLWLFAYLLHTFLVSM